MAKTDEYANLQRRMHPRNHFCAVANRPCIYTTLQHQMDEIKDVNSLRSKIYGRASHTKPEQRHARQGEDFTQ